MIVKQKRIRLLFPFIALLLTLSLTITGCGGAPTPQPQPTFVLNVSPGTEVQVGESVAIVAGVEPLEKLDLKWSVSGTAEGKLNTDTGEQVVYTAGKEGTDIVVAEGTTASGAPVKQTVTLTVLGEPVAEVPPTPTPQPPTDTPSLTPTETPTPMPQPPTPIPECESFRPRLQGAADFAGEVEIKTPDNCTTGLPTETIIPAAGTYEGIPDDVDIWMLVYPPNLLFYPQLLNACEGANMIWGDGKWQVPVYLGAKGGDPEWFDIVVVLVDQETSQFFSDWGRQGCRSGQYLGIPAAQLEQMNITEKSYIIVQTLD